MKRTTAIRHLETLAAEAGLERIGGAPGPLTELWVAGPLLDPATASVDSVTVVLMLNLPVEEVPWRSRPSVADQLVAWLRIDKNPLRPLWRPDAWPAWNAEHRRVARIWSAESGLEEGVMAELRAQDAQVGIEPDALVFEAQMRTELGVTRRHLDESLEGFYEREWQREHKSGDLFPGDHLWWAAYGYREIEKALGTSMPPLGVSSSETSTATVHRLKITLRDVEPPVWRRVLVPSDTSLDDLAWMLLRAMGWGGSHLHAYDVDGTRYGIHHPDFESLGDLDEAQFRLMDVLATPGTTLRFDYDFGDGWEHDVEVEAIDPAAAGQTYPACIAGRRACPPDDSGGPWGYQNKLEVLADPSDPEYDDMREWMPEDWDPEYFRVAEADNDIRERPPPMHI